MSLVFQRVWEYAHDVVEGHIVACQKHKWAAQRFIDDMYKLEEESSPYYFDMEILEDFDEWAKQFIHAEGILANQPIILNDFQLFLAANIFGFRKKSNDARRFRKVYIQLARKNAKSQFLALIATYETFLSDEKHRVYIAGWSKEQSDEVYGAVHEQIRNAEILKGTYKDSYGKITRIKTSSIIQPLSKEARKLGDGKNPSVGIVDEYHAHETSEIYDVLISGMVARKSPLMVVITTAGFNLSRPCYKEYEYTSRILDPDLPAVENDDYFVMICELDKDDDIKDERNWAKANPIVTTYEEGLVSLRSDLKTALEQPEKMRSFLTKNMNIWVDKRDNGYMVMSKWNACGRTIEWEEFRGKEVVIGLDLSAKIDLTSVTFEVKDETYKIKSHSFMPEDTLTVKISTDKVPYDKWVKEGWVTTTPGAVVDYSFIKEFIKEKERNHGIIIREICADPWNATQFMQDMEAEGYTVVEIRQGIQTLGGPTKDFREQVYLGNLEHDNSPVFSWSVNNAVTRQDANENIMLDKSKSTERIDPIASAINAHVRSMVIQEQKTSVYKKRGIVTL